MKLTFLGAAGTVTGSKILVETERTRILVDCGLFQGVKPLRLRNWEPLPFDPGSLDAVVLTHAHIDHSGQLPALVRAGFAGPIYCTPPTRSLCGLLLPDSGHIHEEDARYANRKKFSKHHPALPLYTEKDALATLPQLESVDFERELSVGDVRVVFRHAGHILGAASISISAGGRTILFSGDLGRRDDLLMRAPEPAREADWVVIESTYGDRQHGEEEPLSAIAQALRRAAERSGMVLIPSFAVGRAQTILYCLHEIFQRGMASPLPVFVNSPMATDATALYQQYADYHRLSHELCQEVFGNTCFTRSVEESKELAERCEPAVILSASGMATGGRILHHLSALLPESRHMVLMPGFQAPGTRGDALARGADTLKIHGKHVPVRAEVVQFDTLSAHADQEDLLDWLGRIPSAPRGVLVNHGEPVASDTLRRHIQDRLGFAVQVPQAGEALDLR